MGNSPVVADVKDGTYGFYVGSVRVLDATSLRDGVKASSDVSLYLAARHEGDKVFLGPTLNGDSTKVGRYFVRDGLIVVNFNTEEAEGIRTLDESLLKEVSPIFVGSGRFGLIGESQPMQEVYGLIEKFAPSNATVLIRGETGTGKEIVARATHEYSARQQHPYLPVNMAAIPLSLLESALFGHEKGSFTGASQRQIGYFEQANQGTIFLDEIGTMPYEAQSRLLRLLEVRKVTRIGGTKEIPIDVRVIAATNADLESMVREGTFRADLYYRLKVAEINIPPLRERTDDIGRLATAFAFKYGVRDNKGGMLLTMDAIDYLKQIPWRGNVRELKNTIERAVLLSERNYLTREDFQFLGKDYIATQQPSGISTGTLEDIERTAILARLKQFQGSGNNFTLKEVAASLGIAARTLQRRMDMLGIVQTINFSIKPSP